MADTSRFISRLRTKVLPNLHHLPESEFRRCLCCERLSVIASFSHGEEAKICIRCRANLRYEMLAQYLRRMSLTGKSVVEMDNRSPLRHFLAASGAEYIQTHYSSDEQAGALDPEGSRCEDIQNTTFPDNSIDVIISSDVLEHVPDLHAAFKETLRILKPGGVHVFTVPFREKSARRAEYFDGTIRHLMEPEYHSDPRNPLGILAYWDFGMDAPEIFGQRSLTLSVAMGPRGRDKRVIWEARKQELP